MKPSKFASKQKNAIKRPAFLLLQATSLAFFVLSIGCQSASKKIIPENVRFYKGKAQVVDKKKDKTEWVYFNTTVAYPRQLRMDLNLVLLNISLGTLTINDNKAQLLSATEGKAYITDDGSRLLLKLMKTELSSRDVIAVFSEQYPLPGWQCETAEGSNETKFRCAKGDIQLAWEALPTSADRQLIIESSRSKVTFVYKPLSSGNTDFELPIPKKFQIIKM